MPRAKRKAGGQVQLPLEPRRSLRSVKKKPVQVIDLSDDGISDGDGDEIKEIEQLPQAKKQKLSSLRGHIKLFSHTPLTTRSPTPELKQSTDNTTNQRDESPVIIDQWIDKYAPNSVSQVAIHSRKLKETKEEFLNMIQGDNAIKILVLSGPAGASKSTVIKCLANEVVPKIRHDSNNKNPIIEYVNDASSESSVTQFGDFLSAAKYRTGKNLSLILVEDLPNVFHEPTKDNFQKALLEWVYTAYNTPPLVICITECEFPNDGLQSQGYNIDNNYTAETILGRKLLMNPRVRRMKFNPVNAQLTKKTLKNIVSNESLLFSKIDRSDIIDKINELSDYGDIKSSICAFQFWAEWKYKNPYGEESLKIGTEPNISLFHAIGKCIFGTKVEGEDDMTTIDKVLKTFRSKPTILKLGLLENYTKFNKSNFSLDTACQITDSLSAADLLNGIDTSLEIATTSTRTAFRKIDVQLLESSGNHSGSTFPREWKVQKNVNLVKQDINRYMEKEFKKRHAFRTFQDSNLLYGFYEPMIHKDREFKNRSKLHYLRATKQKLPKELLVSSNTFISERLGGPFREIFGDGDIVADDEVVRDTYFQVNNSTHDGTSDMSGSEVDSEDDDPIRDSDDEDEGFGEDDTFENELVHLSQKPSLKPTVSTLSLKSKNAEFLEDFDEDDDFNDSDF